jgi:hypothetical protein
MPFMFDNLGFSPLLAQTVSLENHDFRQRRSHLISFGGGAQSSKYGMDAGGLIHINTINNYNHDHQVEFSSLPGAKYGQV